MLYRKVVDQLVKLMYCARKLNPTQNILKETLQMYLHIYVCYMCLYLYVSGSMIYSSWIHETELETCFQIKRKEHNNTPYMYIIYIYIYVNSISRRTKIVLSFAFSESKSKIEFQLSLLKNRRDYLTEHKWVNYMIYIYKTINDMQVTCIIVCTR